MSKSIYEFFKESVLDWAKLGVDDSEWGTDTHKALMWGLVEEEHKELYKGYKEDNSIEIRDALCDCMVTLIQLNELVNPGSDKIWQDDYTLTPVNKYIALAKPIVEDRKDSFVSMLLGDLVQCFDYYTSKGVWSLHEDMVSVLKSNWSKYPLLSKVLEFYGESRDEAIQAACDWIESNTDYKDVVGIVKTDEGGDERVVFRAEGGNGKIMKPWCFVEPEIK